MSGLPDRPTTVRDRSLTAQLVTGVCSILFTIGTTLQNFVIINAATMRQMMELAGQTPQQAAAAAPGFLLGFRIVGCVYIIGNAIGILALLRRGWTWLFWVVIAVNLTQAAGVVMVPREMFTVAAQAYGFWGVLPSIITDGGALLLSVGLLLLLAITRRPWGRSRPATADIPGHMEN